MMRDADGVGNGLQRMLLVKAAVRRVSKQMKKEQHLKTQVP